MAEAVTMEAVTVEGVKMEWLMEDAIHKNAGVSLAKMTVDIGVLSECHKHPNCTETVHLLSGKIKQLVGKNG